MGAAEGGPALTRVALLSGGKDSLYAAMQLWPVDYGVVLVYDFPRPSPHLLNLGKTVETLILTGIPVVFAHLRRGHEREETVKLLQRLGADEIVAGDVYVEDHLRYMESVAAEAGARLREPLWGMDPVELVHREAEAGIEALFTGADGRMRRWLGRVFSQKTVEELVEYARRVGADPLGEQGEYHTLALSSPLHETRLGYSVIETLEVHGYYLLRVV